MSYVAFLASSVPIDDAQAPPLHQEDVAHRQVIVCGDERDRHACDCGTTLGEPIPVFPAPLEERRKKGRRREELPIQQPEIQRPDRDSGPVPALEPGDQEVHVLKQPLWPRGEQ